MFSNMSFYHPLHFCPKVKSQIPHARKSLLMFSGVNVFFNALATHNDRSENQPPMCQCPWVYACTECCSKALETIDIKRLQSMQCATQKYNKIQPYGFHLATTSMVTWLACPSMIKRWRLSIDILLPIFCTHATKWSNHLSNKNVVIQALGCMAIHDYGSHPLT